LKLAVSRSRPPVPYGANFYYYILLLLYECNDVVQMFNVVFRSMTIMLVVVSTYSFVMSFPRIVATGLNEMNSDRNTGTKAGFWFHQFAFKVISPWNYCGNFFFYILSGRQFRNELKLMFCCRKRPSGAKVLNILVNDKRIMCGVVDYTDSVVVFCGNCIEAVGIVFLDIKPRGMPIEMPFDRCHRADPGA